MTAIERGGLSDRVAEVRALLRTNLNIDEIAARLGCGRHTVASFVRREGLCDMRARSEFIRKQRSLARA